MGDIDGLGVVLATLAFWLVGALWYGLLFARRWQAETGAPAAVTPARRAVIIGLTLAFEMLAVLTLAHLVARTAPPPHVVLMMASGFAVGVMAPALGINYLHQNRSLALFLIDAGHLLFGMLAAGAVLVARG